MCKKIKKIIKKLAIMEKSGYNNKVHNEFREWEQIPLLNCFILNKRRKVLANIEERVEKLVEGKINEIGYELYDVEYAKEGKNYFLRIFIDKEDGIDLNDCEKVNNAIADLLDEADYIKEQYFLEVSSPGIERVIRKDKHLQKSIGKEVEIKLFKKDEKNNKEYKGILEKFDAQTLTINEDEEIIIQRKDIAQIKEVYNWQ